jgi:hypothetical protein
VYSSISGVRGIKLSVYVCSEIQFIIRLGILGLINHIRNKVLDDEGVSLLKYTPCNLLRTMHLSIFVTLFSCLAFPCTLKMEAIFSSEIYVSFWRQHGIVSHMTYFNMTTAIRTDRLYFLLGSVVVTLVVVKRSGTSGNALSGALLARYSCYIYDWSGFRPDTVKFVSIHQAPFIALGIY